MHALPVAVHAPITQVSFSGGIATPAMVVQKASS
jgi:hypothetical protein